MLSRPNQNTGESVGIVPFRVKVEADMADDRALLFRLLQVIQAVQSPNIVAANSEAKSGFDALRCAMSHNFLSSSEIGQAQDEAKAYVLGVQYHEDDREEPMLEVLVRRYDAGNNQWQEQVLAVGDNHDLPEHYTIDEDNLHELLANMRVESSAYDYPDKLLEIVKLMRQLGYAGCYEVHLNRIERSARSAGQSVFPELVAKTYEEAQAILADIHFVTLQNAQDRYQQLEETILHIKNAGAFVYASTSNYSHLSDVLIHAMVLLCRSTDRGTVGCERALLADALMIDSENVEQLVRETPAKTLFVMAKLARKNAQLQERLDRYLAPAFSSLGRQATLFKIDGNDKSTGSGHSIVFKK